MSFKQKGSFFAARFLVWAMTGHWISTEPETPVRARTAPTQDRPARSRLEWGCDGDSISWYVDWFTENRSFAYYDHPACHELLRNS